MLERQSPKCRLVCVVVSVTMFVASFEAEFLELLFPLGRQDVRGKLSVFPFTATNHDVTVPAMFVFPDFTAKSLRDCDQLVHVGLLAVSYTHLTLPTKA